MTDQNCYSSIPFFWFKNHLTKELLPRWYKASVTKCGLFHPCLDREWKKIGGTQGTLVSQSRLLYVFSIGFLKTGNRNYKLAVLNGADFLINHFYDKTNGGFYWSCAKNGEVLEDFKDSYGHAFLILGFVHTYKVTGVKKYLKIAIDVFYVIEDKFQDDYGGLVWKKTNDWLDNDKQRRQNPLMHYFEAILALFETLSDKTTPKGFLDNFTPVVLKRRAEKIVDFLFPTKKLTSEFLLSEYYTLDWKPLNLDQSGPLSSGHHFEWAFLLSYGVEVGLLKKKRLSIAKHCLKSALYLGYQENGKIWSYMNKGGKLTDSNLYWWDYSEALRTLIHFIVQHNRLDLRPVFQNIFSFVQKYFIDPEFGGWYLFLDSDGKPLNTNKGHFGKLDYHQTGLCYEAGRLENKLFPN